MLCQPLVFALNPVVNVRCDELENFLKPEAKIGETFGKKTYLFGALWLVAIRPKK